MNYLWAGMILIGIIYGACTGNLQGVADGALTSAQDAVSLAVTMSGVMALWVGLMEIGQQSGLIGSMSRGMRPLIRFLFPNLPQEHPACEPISMNMIANILGLGWAATPAGLRAMEALSELEEERRNGEVPGYVREKGIASNEMCTFLIINISSLQLIPVNIIAYRSQYGSPNPSAIVGPALAATAVSTVAGIIYCKLLDRKEKK